MSIPEWAEPIAAHLEQSRREVAKLAADLTSETWDRPSAYEGWSCKDHLSHLVESHRNVQGVMTAIIEGRDPDFGRFDRLNEINEENRRKHAGTPVADLAADFQAESVKTQALLDRFGPEDGDYSLGPMKLGQALSGFAMHDSAHADEIRKAALV